jgi:uncharacterized membrane protein
MAGAGRNQNERRARHCRGRRQATRPSGQIQQIIDESSFVMSTTARHSLASSLQSTFGKIWATLSFVGLAVATLFFAASLTPSLLPRHFAVQGLLSGIALAVGYGVGAFCVGLWRYLELPKPQAHVERISKWICAVVVAVIAASYLWRATVWQNSIRQLMEMEPVTTTYPWLIAVMACLTACLLVLIARGLRRGWLFVHRQVNRVVPRRVSYVVSTLLVGVILLLMINHVFARIALNIADGMFLQIDEFVDEDIEQPADELASGSAESLVDWDSIGLRGKNFIVGGPTSETISKFWSSDAERPLRVYVGLRSKDTTEERVKLALQELIRVGGFKRRVLVVATPTGTGWLDPGAVDTIEYLHAGDTAIVSVQYSYLPSWITILVDQHRSRDTARALFDEVYGYWTKLPKDTRPKLYLHGLSLGALGSESSADLFTVFEDPIQGGVWSGPPFPSRVWSRFTRARNAGSAYWLPQFRDGSMLRFMGRESQLSQSGIRWGPMRFVYIQHASDPMCFFAPELLYRRPDWLVGERGPDVSPYLRWYPSVTFLQTAFDLPMATSVPTGYGHNYDPASYIDAWISVTAPKAWDNDDTARLKREFAEEL